MKKKLIFIAFASLCAVFTACQKENNPVVTAKITGPSSLSAAQVKMHQLAGITDKHHHTKKLKDTMVVSIAANTFGAGNSIIVSYQTFGKVPTGSQVVIELLQTSGSTVIFPLELTNGQPAGVANVDGELMETALTYGATSGSIEVGLPGSDALTATWGGAISYNCTIRLRTLDSSGNVLFTGLSDQFTLIN